MGEEANKGLGEPRGDDAAESRNTSVQSGFGGGWVTTEIAAAALRVSPRTIRDYARTGDLEAISEGEGVRKRWLISIDAVQEMRNRRNTSGDLPRGRRHTAAGDALAATEAAIDAATAVDAAELVAQLQELQYRLGRAEARVELQAVAESTVREERDRLIAQVEEERRRADRLEGELREVRQPPPRPPDNPETSTKPEPGIQAPASDAGQPRRSWWRRFFGFE